jgi:hypothetical protein
MFGLFPFGVPYFGMGPFVLDGETVSRPRIVLHFDAMIARDVDALVYIGRGADFMGLITRDVEHGSVMPPEEL